MNAPPSTDERLPCSIFCQRFFRPAPTTKILSTYDQHPHPHAGQWPNKHTILGRYGRQGGSFILHKSASLAASFAYLLANLEAKDVPRILNKVLELASRDFSRIAGETLNDTKETQEKLDHFAMFHQGSCRDLKRYFDPDQYQNELEDTVEAFCDLIDQQKNLTFKSFLHRTNQSTDEYQKEEIPENGRWVPIRKFKSPILRLEEFASHDKNLLKICKAYKKEQHDRLKNAYTLSFLDPVTTWMARGVPLRSQGRSGLRQARGIWHLWRLM